MPWPQQYISQNRTAYIHTYIHTYPDAFGFSRLQREWGGIGSLSPESLRADAKNKGLKVTTLPFGVTRDYGPTRGVPGWLSTKPSTSQLGPVVLVCFRTVLYRQVGRLLTDNGYRLSLRTLRRGYAGVVGSCLRAL